MNNDTINNVTIPTAIISYDLVKQNLKIITSWDKNEIFTKVDTIHATSAAISYFKPCLAVPVNKKNISYTLSDGGTGANNPTLCLLTKAMELYPTADFFEIVSIGSGNINKPLFYKEYHDAGLTRWANEMPNIFTKGQNAKENNFLNELFSGKKKLLSGKYSRWSPTLDKDNKKLDNTNINNLETILQATDNYIESRENDFNELVKRLTPPKDVF